MCRRVECAKCGRPTYAGCGAHVEQVLAGVAPADRCQCREGKAPAPTVEPERRSWLKDVFRR